MDPDRFKIYNSGVLQGKQGAHQSFLFLNKQGLEKKDDSVGRLLTTMICRWCTKRKCPTWQSLPLSASASRRKYWTATSLYFMWWASSPTAASQSAWWCSNTRCFLTIFPCTVITSPIHPLLHKQSGSGLFQWWWSDPDILYMVIIKNTKNQEREKTQPWRIKCGKDFSGRIKDLDQERWKNLHKLW